MGADNQTVPAVTEDDVRALARTAGLWLRPGRAEALAMALEADLQIIRPLRAVDAAEAHPLGAAPLVRGDDNGRL